MVEGSSLPARSNWTLNAASCAGRRSPWSGRS